MPASALLELVRSNRLQELDEAWVDQLGSPGSAAGYAAVIDELCSHNMASKALALGSAMVDALAEAERFEDARALAQALVARGAHNEALLQRLIELLQRLHAGEDWFEAFRSRSGLSGSPGQDSLAAFEHLRRFTPGNVVFHAAGWGEGVIEELAVDREEVRIRFASGRTQELPLSTVLDTFKPLDEDDLRAMKLQRPDQLAELARTRPAELIRKVTRMLRGRATSQQVKDALVPGVVTTGKWAGFWKRAKAAAAVDPWLQVEGSATRPVFVLRKRPLSLASEAERAMSFADHLGHAMAICRDYFERCEEADVREQLLELAEARLKTALAARDQHEPAHVLDGLLLLEEHGREVDQARAQEELRALLEEDGTLLPERFRQLHAKERAVTLLPTALGEDWPEKVIEALPRTPASVAESMVDLLQEHGHAARLLALWPQIAPYPRRHPTMTYLLGRQYAGGAFDDLAGRPSPVAVARVLLHLLRVLTDEGRSTQVTRLMTRVVSLLTGRRPFLAEVLETVDIDEMRDFVGITERGGPDFPAEVSSTVLRAVARRFPDIAAAADVPFWEQDVVLVTAAGLARQREEYRKLVDERIPANSAAIGAAASLGDLSENSEWEAAIEEQRNLTNRASEMDAMLRKAKLIEDQHIPEGVVAPGTKVTLEHADGHRQSWRLLGPWDAVEDDVLSYLAPLAKDLLGKEVGNEVTLPGSGQTARIVAIERAI